MDKRISPFDDAEEILEEAPCAFLSTTPDGTIVMVNSRLIEWTGKSRQELTGGTRLTDLFPKGEQIYFETHLRLLLLAEGEINEISCHLQRPGLPALPVFMNSRVKSDDAGKPIFVRTTFFDATDRTKYEEELRSRRQQADYLGAIVRSTGDAIASMELDRRVRTWNAGAENLFGYTEAEAVGQTIDALILPDDKKLEIEDLYRRVQETGGTVLLETERKRRDGELVPVELRTSAIRDDTGRTTGISVIYRDLTNRRRIQEELQLVLSELTHRTKNLMSIVQAVANLSGRDGDFETFRVDFAGRMRGLSTSIDLLVNGQWHSVDLETQIRDQLEHFCSEPDIQLILDGPDLDLLSTVTDTFGMAWHELATNALKYGALSVEGGRIEVSWSVESELYVEWRERDGPEVSAPDSHGFGRRVIKEIIENVTGGTVSLDYPKDGFRWSLRAPVDKVLRAREE